MHVFEDEFPDLENYPHDWDAFTSLLALEVDTPHDGPGMPYNSSSGTGAHVEDLGTAAEFEDVRASEVSLRAPHEGRLISSH